MEPVKVIVVGAGMRGMGYAEFATHCPDKCQIVGVADPREWYRNNLKEKFNIPDNQVFSCWTEVAEAEKFADAVLICTQDNMHVEPSVAFAEKKYHILLEKPMAPSEEDCRTIVEAAVKNGVIFGVCHVLRYTAYTKELKRILDSGRIGEIITMQHLEPVGYWHQAHSFVRGNWRNEEESSFMLLAKSCHDMDWMRYIMGKKCTQVSSFGSLKHFRKEEQPKGASDRCVTCRIEPTCPYSAKKIYFNFYNKGLRGWPVDILTPEVDPENILQALENGPYGRCVYACDNDVVDNQVVNMQFEGGATASFLMTAFTAPGGRKTTIHGTRGEITGDSTMIKIYDYLTETTEEIDTSKIDTSVLGGHGGGDGGIMADFCEAISKNDPSLILTGPEVSLETHLMAFSAEKARLNGSVEPVRGLND